VVLAGETVLDPEPVEGVTVPTSWLMEIIGTGVPVADQERRATPPLVMDAGVAKKEEMEGAVEVETGGGVLPVVTATVTWAVAVPPLPVAVKV
jgi:hypothetical protein